MEISGYNNKSKILLSREMSHFLLRLQDVDMQNVERVRAKILNYGDPFTAPFIAFDEILIDPSVGSFISPLYSRIENNPYFKKLKNCNSINFINVPNEMYYSIVHEAADLASRIIRSENYYFPENLQPDYLLETPLYLFFKESEPFVELVNSNLDRPIKRIEEIAFLFSTCYSALFSERLNVPMLISRVGAKLLDQIPELLFCEANNTIQIKLLESITSEISAIKKVSVPVPNITLDTENSNDYIEFINHVIELRCNPGSKELRKKLFLLIRSLGENPDDDKLINIVHSEIISATGDIIRSSSPNRKKYFKKSLLSAFITAPLSFLGGLGTLGGQLGIEEIQCRIVRKKLGWFYFVFENAPFTKLSH